MARISRRRFLKVTGGGAAAAKTGGIAAILMANRTPAHAQATTVHWLRWTFRQRGTIRWPVRQAERQTIDILFFSNGVVCWAGRMAWTRRVQSHLVLLQDSSSASSSSPTDADDFGGGAGSPRSSS